MLQLFEECLLQLVLGQLELELAVGAAHELARLGGEPLGALEVGGKRLEQTSIVQDVAALLALARVALVVRRAIVTEPPRAARSVSRPSPARRARREASTEVRPIPAGARSTKMHGVPNVGSGAGELRR